MMTNVADVSDHPYPATSTYPKILVWLFMLYIRAYVRVYVCACVYVRVRMRVYIIYNIFNI